jgi:hypothetical protein
VPTLVLSTFLSIFHPYCYLIDSFLFSVRLPCPSHPNSCSWRLTHTHRLPNIISADIKRVKVCWFTYTNCRPCHDLEGTLLHIDSLRLLSYVFPIPFWFRQLSPHSTPSCFTLVFSHHACFHPCRQRTQCCTRYYHSVSFQDIWISLLNVYNAIWAFCQQYQFEEFISLFLLLAHFLHKVLMLSYLSLGYKNPLHGLAKSQAICSSSCALPISVCFQLKLIYHLAHFASCCLIITDHPACVYHLKYTYQ